MTSTPSMGSVDTDAAVQARERDCPVLPCVLFTTVNADLVTAEDIVTAPAAVGAWRSFEGAPIVLVHHRGRKSRRDYVTPVMYLPDDRDDSTIYVFATKGGTPSNPDWYYNLIQSGEGTIERGTETYAVTVGEVRGDERDRIYDEQARRYPGLPTTPSGPRASAPSP